MSGGQRQGAAGAAERAVGPQTHPPPRQPGGPHAQGNSLLRLRTRSEVHALLRRACKSLPARPRLTHTRARVPPAAVPEDGSVALTVQPAHGEAALVQPALPAHRALALPSPLQGAVRFRGRAAAAGTRTDDSVDNHSRAALPASQTSSLKILFL